jgi:hypothetical protein
MKVDCFLPSFLDELPIQSMRQGEGNKSVSKLLGLTMSRVHIFNGSGGGWSRLGQIGCVVINKNEPTSSELVSTEKT